MKNIEHIEKVTENVLDVYKAVNPSFVENLTQLSAKKKYIQKWIRLITEKLSIPPLLFKNARVLDVGCGTGEKSLIYEMMGATVHGIDANEDAIELARKKSVEWGMQNTTFEINSVFDLCRSDQFDIVISDGMIHHTADPFKAFCNIAGLVKKGGILILGVAEECAFFQRKLQRYFVNRIAGADSKTKLEVAMILFKDKFERASIVSGRSIESVAYDSFINPQIIPVSIFDIEKWMSLFNITLNCSWPPSGMPLVSDSQYHPPLPNSHNAIVEWKNLSRLIWLLKEEGDDVVFSDCGNTNGKIRDFLNNISIYCSDEHLDIHAIKEIQIEGNILKNSPISKLDVQNEIKILFDEIIHVHETIEKLKSHGEYPVKIAESLNFKRLFSGFHGVGMVYYRGTRKIEYI